MQGQTTRIVSQAICFIENHLHDKLELDTVAAALHYSKFHLHRMFTKTVGLTIHDYAQRRQLTEAAKLLVFSQKSIMEIALISGYESQQAFTNIFKAMYKMTPAEFRAAEEFYPLQLEMHLDEEPVTMDLTKDDITFATLDDIDAWMELVSLTIDGYPCLNETEYRENLRQYIVNKSALLLRIPQSEFRSGLREEGMAIAAMGFTAETGSIDFLAVHPQYRNLGIAKLFVDKLADELLCGKEISVTTYREGDKADTGYREEYIRLGFAERELLVEYGYPTQRFVFPPKYREDARNEEYEE